MSHAGCGIEPSSNAKLKVQLSCHAFWPKGQREKEKVPFLTALHAVELARAFEEEVNHCAQKGLGGL